MIRLHLMIILGLAAGWLGLAGGEHFAAFAVGAVLSFVNFYILARIIPHLVWGQSGGTFSLVFGFYLRLLLTGCVLFLCIAWLEFPVVSLLLGLSTVLLTILVWFAKFVLTHKHKEA
ncbi:MAG: ATP synthase subunit I [Desulfohalobiaceae bacterium]|nr:ATP synthase subunit I [Desulfohalobiaceae bacterium]